MTGGSSLTPKPARYLLRFDDLCPTISRTRWERFLPLIEKFGLHPILAIVPDNLDPDLDRAAPDPDFWPQMRALEAAGATIALHGYRHLCRSRGRSLIPLHRRTEFAGVALETQTQWIDAGLTILRNEGLDPRLWVAPRHGFDWNTLRALRSGGIGVLSDGLARVPFTRGGLTWIPQQLWAPVDKSEGLWTICVHSNSAHALLVNQLETFLRSHAAQFSSVDRVLAELKPRPLTLSEQMYEKFATWRLKISRSRKRIRRRVRS